MVQSIIGGTLVMGEEGDWSNDHTRMSDISRKLDSLKWAAVMEAFDAVKQQGPEGEPLLLTILEQEVPKQQRLHRTLTFFVVILSIMSLIWLVAGMLLGSNKTAGWLFFIPMLILLFSCSFGGVVATGSIPTRAQKRAALCLTLMYETLEDVRCVGPLLEGTAFWFGTLYGGKWTQAAILALTRLLPRLHDEESARLTKRQIEALESAARQAWKTRDEAWWQEAEHPLPHFYAAVLQSLGQVGSAAAVRPIERLAQWKADSAPRLAVRSAAQEALVLLRTRTARPQPGLP